MYKNREPESITMLAEVLDKPTQRMEQAGLSDYDIMAIRAVAIYEGVNLNNSLFEREELQKSVNTLIGKPFRILFDGVNPTGHGYNMYTGKFDPLVTNIGYIDYAYGAVNEETGLYEIIVEIGMWQRYYPEIANRMRQLHRERNLKFSVEVDRDFEITPEGYRRCYNLTFRGLTVVQNPSFENAKSLLVAEILNEGGKQRMDEIMKLIEEVKGTISTEVAEQFSSHLGVLNSRIETLESELLSEKEQTISLKGELAKKDSEIEVLEQELKAFREEKERAEKEALGKERFEKLSKFGEVDKTVDELAEMSKEQFVDLMAVMVENYKPELASANSEIATPVYKVNKQQEKDRKEQLLQMVEAFWA